MAVRHILLYPQREKALRRKSKAVKKINAKVRELAQDLTDTLLMHPGAGLAAPQIGVFERVVAVRFGQDDGEMQDPLILVNPKITRAGPLVAGFDGCLSIPNLMTWDTLRPEWLEFSARDQHGKPIKMRVEDSDARLVHHEIDHLDGVLFLDHLTPESKLYTTKTNDEGKEELVRIR